MNETDVAGIIVRLSERINEIVYEEYKVGNKSEAKKLHS